MTIDTDARRLDVDVSDSELATRAAEGRVFGRRIERGVLAKYARRVSSASRGAVTR